MDTEVRDTWEIQPDVIKFDNPAWKVFVESTVVNTVCQQLGVAGHASPPCAELYKLLIYETGSQ